VGVGIIKYCFLRGLDLRKVPKVVHIIVFRVHAKLCTNARDNCQDELYNTTRAAHLSDVGDR
jgi:hypothetical protein